MRAFAYSAALVLLAGCADSGCSGMEPIPGGFPLDRRVENAVQVRLTPSGVDYLEDNLADIVEAMTGGSLLFPVPPTTDSFLGNDIYVCRDGGCFINIEITSVNLVPTEPNQLRIHMNVRAWASNADGSPAPFPLRIEWWIGSSDCTANIDTRRSGSPELPVTGTIVFRIDEATRYTRIEFIELDATSGFEDDDISIGGGGMCNVIDWLKGFFVGQLTDGLNDQLTSAIEGFTCLACETGADCPEGATCDREGICRRGDQCVPTVLGTEGRMDLGSLSAMLQGEVDVLVAAGGYADANGGGLSLGIWGGAEAGRRSACVPHDLPAPSLGPVPVSPTIRGAASCPSCVPPETHLALGVSETFLNRFGYGMHQSGALCVGLGGGSLPISTGMLALIMPSLRNVTWGATAPVGIELRPNQPPVFELGASDETEPLIAVTMADLSLDFYVWAHDRWARLFQANLDLTVDLDLRAVAGEVELEVRGLRQGNLTIREATLLNEDPQDLAEAFAVLITDMVGPMLGDMGAFALPDMAGFRLSIPDGGLTHLDEAGEEFLVVWATLGLAEEVSLAPRSGGPVDTSAAIVELRLPPTEAFGGLAGPREVPRLSLALDGTAEPGEELEFRTRVDSGFWSPWRPEREVVLESHMFLFQARHRVRVQARVAGRPETADPSPAELEVLIDTVPPEVEALARGGLLEVSALDLVSPPGRIDLGWRFEGEAGFLPVPSEGLALDEIDRPIEIRAEDEAGNVSVTRHALRGRLPADPDAGGCGGCAATGSGGRGALAIALLLAGLLLLGRRRWSGALLPLLLAAGASAAVAACSGPSNFRCEPDEPGCCESDEDCTNGRCCPDGHYCVEFTRERDTCPEGSHCAEIPALDGACAYLACPSCEEGDESPRGLIGMYSSVAVTPAGDLWAAAYAAGQTYNRSYGDLAVAFVQGRTDRVPRSAWVAIDGVPAEGTVRGSPSGWRGGIEDPGDDVGRYASVAVDSGGNPAVAYYDTTHRALMFMAGSAELWDRPVLVDGGDGADAGRFADLLILPDGRPAIAYMHIEKRGDGSISTSARYVEGTTPSGSAWGRPVDLAVLDPTPCSMAVCSSGDDEVCDLATGRCVVPSGDCGAGCADGQACVGGECHETLTGVPDLVEGTGIWPDLAQGPGATLGVVFYDRTHGDLVGVGFDGSAWGAPQVLAGGPVDGGQGGDMGWAPSLHIDGAGLWHVSYVDGLAEDVRYLNTAGVNEIVDGRSLGTHWSIRGDDSSIFVANDGTVRVAYQDATELRLWLAERDATGLWTTRQLIAPGVPETAAQGFYVNQVRAGNTSVVSAWYWDPSTGDNAVLLFWL